MGVARASPTGVSVRRPDTRVMRPTTSIVRDQERGSDAVWFYDQPYPAVAEIKGHVAFYADRIDLTVSSPDRPED
jgi:hypothetical protein